MGNIERYFHVWRVTKNLEPIEGTDKTYVGVSARDILEKIAKEKNVKYNRWERFIKLENGESIHIMIGQKIN